MEIARKIWKDNYLLFSKIVQQSAEWCMDSIAKKCNTQFIIMLIFTKGHCRARVQLWNILNVRIWASTYFFTDITIDYIYYYCRFLIDALRSFRGHCVYCSTLYIHSSEIRGLCLIKGLREVFSINGKIKQHKAIKIYMNLYIQKMWQNFELFHWVISSNI